MPHGIRSSYTRMRRGPADSFENKNDDDDDEHPTLMKGLSPHLL